MTSFLDSRAEIYPTSQACLVQLERHPSHSIPDHAFEGESASAADPERGAVNLVRRTDFAEDPTGRNGHHLEKPTQNHLTRLLVGHDVDEVRFVLKRTAQHRRQGLRL
jgi:hypothetical protein